MFRFTVYALPLLLVVLALFGLVVELAGLEPQPDSVLKLAVTSGQRVPLQVVLGAWLLEATGLLALFLLIQGRCGAWLLDGLVAGWLGWIFRGPLLVITIVVATGQPQETWWRMAMAWWVLYTFCGLLLALLWRRAQRSPPPATFEVKEL